MAANGGKKNSGGAGDQAPDLVSGGGEALRRQRDTENIGRIGRIESFRNGRKGEEVEDRFEKYKALIDECDHHREKYLEARDKLMELLGEAAVVMKSKSSRKPPVADIVSLKKNVSVSDVLEYYSRHAVNGLALEWVLANEMFKLSGIVDVQRKMLKQLGDG